MLSREMRDQIESHIANIFATTLERWRASHREYFMGWFANNIEHLILMVDIRPDYSVRFIMVNGNTGETKQFTESMTDDYMMDHVGTATISVEKVLTLMELNTNTKTRLAAMKRVGYDLAEELLEDL